MFPLQELPPHVLAMMSEQAIVAEMETAQVNREEAMQRILERRVAERANEIHIRREQEARPISLHDLPTKLHRPIQASRSVSDNAMPGAPLAVNGVCGQCAGVGFYKEAVPFGHPRFGKAFPCACKAAEREAARMVRLHELLPKDRGRYAHVTLDGFSTEHSLPGECVWPQSLYDPADQKWVDGAYSVEAQRAMLRDIKAAVTAWARDPRGRWLFAMGNFGSGKTHLLTAALNARAQTQSTHYDSVPQLLKYLRGGFKDNSTDDRLDALLAVDVLMLDDLGAQHVSGWNDEKLFEIINERDRFDRLTVVTSNCPLEQLQGGRVMSRLVGRCDVLQLVAFDYRMLQAMKRQQEVAA